MAFDLPPQDGPDRDAAILKHISDGDFEINWGTVRIESGGHVLDINVFADALKIGGVRINASATLEQQLADALGCSLLTPKLADLIFLQRGISLPPSPQPISSSTDAMVAHSARIDASLAAAGGASAGQIVQTVGKSWVICNGLQDHPGKAANYGWHFPGSTFGGSAWGAAVTPPLRLIQDLGFFHDDSHVDYSQTVTLAHRACLADGRTRDLLEVLQDPDLAPLISHEGPLRVLRQPGVEPYQLSIASRLPSGAGLAMGAVAGAAIGGPPGAVAGAFGGLVFDVLRGRKV